MAGYGEILVELLNAHGVEHVFYNPGYDVVPVIGTLAQYRAAGKKAPASVLCLDESVAMAAAHGSYMITGRPQVVLVHSELGTQQIGGALHQAQWGRAPIILCTALRGPANRLNWRGEQVDQGRIVRDYVKWDCKVDRLEALGEIFHRAFRIAATAPQGPVYLYLPGDLILGDTGVPAESAAFYSVGKDNDTDNDTSDDATPVADPEILSRIADMLLQAEHPLIMAGYSGRNHKAVAALVQLAETLGARVVTSPVRLNFPADHPLCALVEPNDGVQIDNPYLESADLLLLIDYDHPYAAPRGKPGAGTKIIHIDIDHYKQGAPLWDRRADLEVNGDSAEIIPVLNTLLRQKITPGQAVVFQDRFKEMAGAHLKLREEWRNLALGAAEQRPISSEWLCYCLNEIIDDRTILVNQTIRPALAVSHQIYCREPGSLAACPGGSIGWALGAALGVKVAAPDKRVISLMGDGAFVYGCPTAALWPAGIHKAGFLSVIFNNRTYGAIKMHLQRSYPAGGDAADIDPSPDYALIAQACGAYGKVITEPSRVLPALKEALHYIDQGIPAVLDVRIA